MRVTLQEMIEGLVAEKKVNWVLNRFREQAKAQAKKKGYHRTLVDDYLASFGIKEEYRRLVDEADKMGDEEVAAKLTKFIRILGISVELEYRPSPWSRWKKGSTLMVVLGYRPVQYPHLTRDQPDHGYVGTRLQHWGVGRHDLLALQQLVDILQQRYQLDYRLEVDFQPMNLSYRQAKRRRNQLLKRPDVGCICVIASPVVNPVADAFARRLMREDDEHTDTNSLPARFRWCFDLRKTEKDPFPYLSFPDGCAVKDEGIYRPDDKGGFVPLARRTHDFILLEQVKKKKRDWLPDLTFWDCGILLISDREDEPVIVVAAGHGGWGTFAALQGLADPFGKVDSCLDSSGGLGSRRALGVVEVPLKKQSKKPVDDIEIDPAHMKKIEQDDWETWNQSWKLWR